ncbi:hypothetical protein C7H19_13680 [Aphanothece hegewaldii CCALA 016]|uniref:Uncharacterized protein n=1 Tax=Aphanothece hegewaldii CCALA 016 TaxID=2107694 RepID=A0A2T1LWH8_9CHRO|nr:hypothetical protein [Aphanothece hegewaldii]PSF36253.1 hypothetical protein C7H19_13680 [Aphanothece hegewaldii CCALA 016]
MKEKFITRITLEQVKKLEDLTDWERVEKMSELEVEQNALTDPDNQPIQPGQQGLKPKKRF